MLEKYWQVTSACDLILGLSNWWKISQLLVNLISKLLFLGSLNFLDLCQSQLGQAQDTSRSPHLLHHWRTLCVGWGCRSCYKESKTSALSAGRPLGPLSILLGKCVLLSLWICLQNKEGGFCDALSQGATRAFRWVSSRDEVRASPSSSAQSKHLASGPCYGLVDLKPSHWCLCRGRWLCYSPSRAAALWDAGLPRWILVFPIQTFICKFFSNVECGEVTMLMGGWDFGAGLIRAQHKLGGILWCCCTITLCF